MMQGAEIRNEKRTLKDIIGDIIDEMYRVKTRGRARKDDYDVGISNQITPSTNSTEDRVALNDDEVDELNLVHNKRCVDDNEVYEKASNRIAPSTNSTEDHVAAKNNINDVLYQERRDYDYDKYERTSNQITPSTKDRNRVRVMIGYYKCIIY